MVSAVLRYRPSANSVIPRLIDIVLAMASGAIGDDRQSWRGGGAQRRLAFGGSQTYRSRRPFGGTVTGKDEGGSSGKDEAAFTRPQLTLRPRLEAVSAASGGSRQCVRRSARALSILSVRARRSR